jgi:hypothetical protein
MENICHKSNTNTNTQYLAFRQALSHIQGNEVGIKCNQPKQYIYDQS